IIALLQDLGRSGITIVIVTHEQDIAGYASRILVLRDGRVIADRRQDPRRAQTGAPLSSPEAVIV
ncbi:MAG: macrolide ABC transporter ATP-binding protein, partial [Proteobacteria bacterium]|nr:macrolide ABC transporter ATP-binding protein [Pseudomonadota bacterium]